MEWLGFVMVCLGGDVGLDGEQAGLTSGHRQLADRFAPWQLESLQRVASLEYRVAANWKLIAQNYSECDHCPTVHPELSRLTHYRATRNDLNTGPCLGGPMALNAGCETMSTDGRHVGPPIRTLDETQRRHVYYYIVFPSLLLSLHPDYVMAHRLRRLAVDCTHIGCEFYVPAEAAEAGVDLSRATRFWDRVNREDWRVCELSQRGISSPAYRPGPYSPHESMLDAFDRHYLAVMQREAPDASGRASR